METLLYFTTGLVVGLLASALAMQSFVSSLRGMFPNEPTTKLDRLGFSALFLGAGTFVTLRPDVIGLDEFMRRDFGPYWQTMLYGTMTGYSIMVIAFIHRKLGDRP